MSRGIRLVLFVAVVVFALGFTCEAAGSTGLYLLNGCDNPLHVGGVRWTVGERKELAVLLRDARTGST